MKKTIRRTNLTNMNKHDFTHVVFTGMSESEYVVIYCKKCGQVSYNSARKGAEIISECK